MNCDLASVETRIIVTICIAVFISRYHKAFIYIVLRKMMVFGPKYF